MPILKDLVNAFAVDERAKEHVQRLGHGSVMELDRSVRSDLTQFVDRYWSEIEPFASDHAYLKEPKDLGMARRRAALAAVLSAPRDELRERFDMRWLGLRDRWDALLAVLAHAGCFFLRRGTIEGYYFNIGDSERKTDRALAEADLLQDMDAGAVEDRYADVLAAMKWAAAVRPVDENLYLRSDLGALLGGAFPRLKAKPTMTDAELNQVAAGPHEARIFELQNASDEERIAITVRPSLLFSSLTIFHLPWISKDTEMRFWSKSFHHRD